MTTGLLRISVVGAGRRVDLAVPPVLPVAELVPGLARRLGLVSYAGLRLCTVAGCPLEDSTGLAVQGVPDGSVLALAEPPPPPVVHDDLVEAVARTSPAGGPRWLLSAGSALVLLLGALTAAAAGEARTAAAVALLLLAGGLVLARAAPQQAVVATTAACGYAAVAAGLLAADLRPVPGVVWAAHGGGALAVASLAAAALPAHRLWMLPALVVATTATAVGAVLSVRTVPLAVLACVLLVLTALVGAAVPWLAVGRISRPAGRVDPDLLAAEARLARELMIGLGVGLGTVQVVVTPVVAGQGPWGSGLAGGASVLALLRARHHAAWAESLPGVLAGGAGLVATAAVALWGHEEWRPIGVLVLAGVGAGALLTQVRGSRPARDGRDARASDAVTRLMLRTLEAGLLVVLLPLLLLVTHGTESLG